MPLTAKSISSNELISSLNYTSSIEIRNQFLNGDLVCVCHDCQIPVFPRKRDKSVLHFVHTSPCQTSLAYHPESIEHLMGKKAMAAWFKKHIKQQNDFEIVLEHSFPNIGKNGRIADVALIFSF
jgi:competence CoiA-like predicted nuclease